MDKILNNLIGILKGITIDGIVTKDEFNELVHWCNFYRQYGRFHPFNELLPIIDSALNDGILTQDEIDDIFWLASKLQSSSEYYDDLTCSLQTLHGILHGLLADNQITDAEIRNLRGWIDDHDFLSKCYPYDEIDSLLTSILEDGVITDNEKDMFKSFIGNFIDTLVSLNVCKNELQELRQKYDVKGICAVCPEIVLPNSTFCFTGVSTTASRKGLQSLIVLADGIFSMNVTKSTDYLIIGAEGNPCWAFSCYGRKVEAAVNLRKEGRKITILHENDFWDECFPYAKNKGIHYELYLK
ncbi:BRCT domain-containing protein [Desulfitobacterium dehalogenans]|nr:BRCT domain-containing protein [Desulfitobacterium dehalogenans]